MHIKRYFLLAILLLAVIGGYVYYEVSAESYPLVCPFTPNQLSLPIALWAIASGLILVVLTLLHLYYLHLKDYFSRRKTASDLTHMEQWLTDKMLGKTTQPHWKTDAFKQLHGSLSRLALQPNPQSETSGNESLDSAIHLLHQVEEGHHSDLKPLHLPETSPWLEQNRFNELSSNEKYAYDVLKKKDQHTIALKQAALQAIIERKDIRESLKHLDEVEIDNATAWKLIELLIDAEDIRSHKEVLKNVAKKGQFSSCDYLKLAKKTKGALSPEEWIAFFELLADNHDAAEESLLYVFLELEMVARAQERLSNVSDNEFQAIRAYLDLKDSGKSYPIDLFFN